MQNKPNHKVDRASVFESNSVSAPGGFLTFSLSLLPFHFFSKQTQFHILVSMYPCIHIFMLPTKRTQLSCSSCKSCQKDDLLYLPKRPI